MALTKMVFIREVKVRQSQKKFFKPIILPKKRTFKFEFNYYDTSGWIVSTLFLEEIEDTKNTFWN